MDYSSKVLLSLVVCVVAIVLSIVVAVTVYNFKEQAAKLEAIKSGATASQLACAFNPPYENTARLILCGEYQLKEPK